MPKSAFHVARWVALAALGVLALLALSACLPVQFGFEPPASGTPVVTQIALVTGTGASPTTPETPVTAAPTEAHTPLSGLTVTPSPTGRATTDASETASPSDTQSPPATETRPPTATMVECTLTHTVRQGERLAQIGALYGVRWQDIASLNGLANPGLIFAGQVLCLPPNARLPNTPTRTPTASATPSPTPTHTQTGTPSVTPDLCQTAPAWFFTPTPPVCPTAAAINSQAAAQRFERGQMLWIAALDQYMVLFDGATASARTMTYLPGPLHLRPGASPDNRVPETPPAGLEQPVSGFGLIWRNEVVGADSVREALGWATQSEYAFNTTYQCQASTTVEWNCYLRGPNGQVLRLYLTPNIGYYWDHW